MSDLACVAMHFDPPALRTNVPPDDSVQHPLQLLAFYRSGALPALITAAAREEQGLGPIAGEDRDVVLALLDLPDDLAAQMSAIEAVGHEKAASLLGDVIRQPEIPAPGYPFIIHAYQQQQLDGATWLLKEVRVWLAGLTISSAMWTAWPPDTPIPDRGAPPA
ncbi:MAG: hypothetical protein JOZ41_13180, partial [Chloroflexi bacterium]|nr:hypothetical protein [Chloroflexota bacterium]